MKNICGNCTSNCCGKSFIGLSNAFLHDNADKFNQILLSNDEITRILNAGYKQYIEKKKANIT